LSYVDTNRPKKCPEQENAVALPTYVLFVSVSTSIISPMVK